MMDKWITLLHDNNYSCIVANKEEIRTFKGRGVSDLYHLYKSGSSFMQGASVVDKVVGKGAAALMVLGGIAEVYTDVISTPARRLLEAAGISTSWKKEVPYIINRSQTGQCPLESACGEQMDVSLIYPIIQEFMRKLETKQNH